MVVGRGANPYIYNVNFIIRTDINFKRQNFALYRHTQGFRDLMVEAEVIYRRTLPLEACRKRQC